MNYFYMNGINIYYKNYYLINNNNIIIYIERSSYYILSITSARKFHEFNFFYLHSNGNLFSRIISLFKIKILFY